MSPLAWLKLGAAIAIGLLLALVANDIRATYAERARLAEEVTGLKATATTTTAVAAAFDAKLTEATEQETAVGDRRGRLDRKYEVLKREDQTVAVWDPGRVPVVLRDADKAEPVDGPAGATNRGEEAIGAEESGRPDPATR